MDSELLELARKRFGQEINPAEEKLFEAAGKGKIALCQNGSKKGVIRNHQFTWLCKDSGARSLVTERGILVDGAEIDGVVDLAWANVPFPVETESCVFNSLINLEHSRLVSLALVNTSIQRLEAFQVKISNSVSLSGGFKACQGVSLVGALIEGDLHCDGGSFFSPDGEPPLDGNGGNRAPSLDASGANIKGMVLLRYKFNAEAVNFTVATIGGNLDCVGGAFTSKGAGYALTANGAKIHGSVLLRNGFKAEGGVDLSVATIDVNLECHGTFIGKDPIVIGEKSIPALEVSGGTKISNVLLGDGLIAEGQVNFSSVTVTYNFTLKDVKSFKNAVLDLRFAKVGKLYNQKKSWPAQDQLFLDGFVYDRIDDKAEANFERQIEWLHLQPKDQFRSQPYEQLAIVLRALGQKEDAKKVMILKNKDYASHVQGAAWFWYGWFGKLIGYGYRPQLVFGLSVAVMVFSGIVFEFGYEKKVIVPTEDKAFLQGALKPLPLKNGGRQVLEDYPKFNAAMYSIETFVPFLKMGLSEHWAPNAHLTQPAELPKGWGRFLRYYLWGHIMVGWVLTTLWVGAITGLVKS
jgi:hypothetical protein